MSTAAQNRRIENWRRDVAELSAPLIIRSDNRSFRSGGSAPVQVYVDDGLSLKNSGVKTSTREFPASQSKSERPRAIARRVSSDHGGYSRRSSRRSPTKSTTRAGTKGGDTYSRRDEYDRYDRYDSPPKPFTSIWSALLPSSRNSRNRTVVYEKPIRRSVSPEYVTRRADPEVTVYSTRPKSVYAPPRAPKKEYDVSRSSAKSAARRGSVGVDDRMRLLEIRDRFREEIDKARQWSQPTRTSRQRDYDRRSSHY